MQSASERHRNLCQRARGMLLPPTPRPTPAGLAGTEWRTRHRPPPGADGATEEEVEDEDEAAYQAAVTEWMHAVWPDQARPGGVPFTEIQTLVAEYLFDDGADAARLGPIVRGIVGPHIPVPHTIAEQAVVAADLVRSVMAGAPPAPRADSRIPYALPRSDRVPRSAAGEKARGRIRSEALGNRFAAVDHRGAAPRGDRSARLYGLLPVPPN